MRVLCFVFMLAALTVFAAQANEPDLAPLRKKLMLAINSKQTTDSLYNTLSQNNKKTPVLVAYMATTEALKAKHCWNPYLKFKYLGLSGTDMQKAIEADPHNIEIRFMRFSIQHNLPGFLGMSHDLNTDRLEIIKQVSSHNYGTADRELTEAIIKFLIASKRCTPAESALLHKHLATLKP